MKEQETTEGVVNLKYPLPLMVGFFLLNVIFLPIMISTILFIVHISVQNWVFPLSVVLSGGITYFMFDRDNKRTVISLLCGIFCLAFALLLCAKTYDTTWDGATYHRSLTGLLKYGWNPLYETFYNYAERFSFLEVATETWYDAYPKATELWAATVYVVFENIEMGKAFNVLGITSLIFVCWAFLLETKTLKNWQSLICGVAFSINTVSFIQSLTYFVDGFLWEMILLFLASLLYLTFYENEHCKKVAYYFIFLSINIGFNVKFSSVIFFGIFGFAFFIYWLIEKCYKKGLKKAVSLVSIKFFILASSVISGFALMGSTSYVINIIRHKNPFYTMIGEGAADIVVSHLPRPYKPLSNINRFICSLFSKTRNMPSTIEWKLPLTFYESEITLSEGEIHAIRIGGWGIFFSAIFLISIAYIVFYFWRNRRKEQRLFYITIMLSIIIIVSIIAIPGLCWARYYAAPAFIPAVALALLCKNINQEDIYINQYNIIFGILSTLLFLNCVPSAVKNYDTIKEYKPIKAKLQSLKYINELGDIKIGYREPISQYHFEGLCFNLIDEGITNFSYEQLDLGKAETIFSPHPLFYTISTPKNLSEYISSIDTDKYFIFMVAKDDASKALTEDVIKSMNKLGLNFYTQDAYRNAYAAIIGNKPMFEQKDDSIVKCNAEFEGVKISMQSASYKGGNNASILLDGKEYAKNQRGLNIVIYNKELHHVTDSVYVDLYENDIVRR